MGSYWFLSQMSAEEYEEFREEVLASMQDDSEKSYENGVQ